MNTIGKLFAEAPTRESGFESTPIESTTDFDAKEVAPFHEVLAEISEPDRPVESEKGEALTTNESIEVTPSKGESVEPQPFEFAKNEPTEEEATSLFAFPANVTQPTESSEPPALPLVDIGANLQESTGLDGEDAVVEFDQDVLPQSDEVGPSTEEVPGVTQERVGSSNVDTSRPETAKPDLVAASVSEAKVAVESALSHVPREVESEANEARVVDQMAVPPVATSAVDGIAVAQSALPAAVAASPESSIVPTGKVQAPAAEVSIPSRNITNQALPSADAEVRDAIQPVALPAAAATHESAFPVSQQAPTQQAPSVPAVEDSVDIAPVSPIATQVSEPNSAGAADLIPTEDVSAQGIVPARQLEQDASSDRRNPAQQEFGSLLSDDSQPEAKSSDVASRQTVASESLPVQPVSLPVEQESVDASTLRTNAVDEPREMKATPVELPRQNAYSVTLDSPELGKIRVHLTDSAGLRARVVAQNELAYHAIAREANNVTRSLEEVGVSLSDFSLEHGGDAFQPGDENASKGTPANRESKGPDSTDAAAEDKSTTNLSQSSAHAGRLNLLA